MIYSGLWRIKCIRRVIIYIFSVITRPFEKQHFIFLNLLLHVYLYKLDVRIYC